MKYTNDPKRVADNIRAERNRVDMSQSEVADKLGLTRATYVTYEKDASKIQVSTLLKLSEIFKCEISAFYLQ